MGFWWGRRRAIDTLVESIIQEGIERRKIDAELASKQREFEFKKLELEMEHLEQIGEERRKDRAEKEAARRARQAAAAHMREVNAQKRQNPNTQGVCKACVNPSDPSLTYREIEWHVNGHKEGPSLWAQ